MAPMDSLVVVVVSLLIGGIGIYVGANFLAGAASYSHAVVTAGIGAVVWVVATALFGSVPLVGPALVLLSYLAVIKWRYGVGWITAAGVALVAWIAALVVLAILAAVNVTSFSAVGIPRA